MVTNDSQLLPSNIGLENQGLNSLIFDYNKLLYGTRQAIK